MYRPLAIATLALLFVSTSASAFEIGGGKCNDQNYQGDEDVPVDTNLYSSAVQHVWSCQVTDVITNITANERYEVDYQAAGLYVGNLGPMKSRTATRSSWKSCTKQFAPATFTRLAPTAGKTRSVQTAPACGFGLRTLRTLKDLLNLGTSAKKLVSTLEDTHSTGETEHILVASTSFDRTAANTWEYTLLLENTSDKRIEMYVDGPWSRLSDTVLEASLGAGESIQYQLLIPAGAAGDDPVEHTALLEFDDGDADFGELRIPIVGPQDLGDGLVGDINGDGVLSLSDGIALNNYLYAGGVAPVCPAATDFNEDGRTDLSDTMALFNYLFQGGAGPENTTVDCGTRRGTLEVHTTRIAPETTETTEYTGSWND